MRHVWNIGLTTAVALLILGGCTAAGTDGGNEDDDGETSTLSIVKDISTGSSSSNPGDLVVYGGELYFSAAEGSARMLWKTDGTNPGTVVASDFGVGMGLNPSPEDLAVHDGALYMGATSGSEQQELHSYTDSGGAELVANINTQPLSGADEPSDPTELMKHEFLLSGSGPELFFNADDGVDGAELWAYDGNTTYMVDDINNGSGSSDPSEIISDGISLYFAADDGLDGEELWTAYVPGVSATIVVEQVRDIVPGGDSSNPESLTVFDGAIWFAADDGTLDKELYQYDPAADSLTIHDTNPNASGNVDSLAVYDGRLFFAAWHPSAGYELWVYDPAVGSPALFQDINPGVSASNPENFAVYNGSLYFTASDGSNGTELWRTDGTPEGTELAMDINAGPDDSNPKWLAVYGSSLYLTADDGNVGNELWRFTVK